MKKKHDFGKQDEENKVRKLVYLEWYHEMVNQVFPVISVALARKIDIYFWLLYCVIDSANIYLAFVYLWSKI